MGIRGVKTGEEYRVSLVAIWYSCRRPWFPYTGNEKCPSARNTSRSKCPEGKTSMRKMISSKMWTIRKNDTENTELPREPETTLCLPRAVTSVRPNIYTWTIYNITNANFTFLSYELFQREYWNLMNYAHVSSNESAGRSSWESWTLFQHFMDKLFPWPPSVSSFFCLWFSTFYSFHSLVRTPSVFSLSTQDIFITRLQQHISNASTRRLSLLLWFTSQIRTMSYSTCKPLLLRSFLPFC